MSINSFKQYLLTNRCTSGSGAAAMTKSDKSGRLYFRAEDGKQ